MKTITMMQLRQHPGEYAFRVRADGESLTATAIAPWRRKDHKAPLKDSREH
jgi:hypothetical protein